MNIKNNKELCNGCLACKNICRSNAISITENLEGFLYPQIDEEKCTNCGLCNKVCSLNYNTGNLTPKYYGVMASDEIRLQSSSGGVFSIIANKIINSGGYVCGAAFDKDFLLKHIIINSLDDLHKLQTSKYIQSNIGTIYSDIKQLLDKNKVLFFVGTPCQVAGLKSFLNKNYENLYTADLSCSGVPSHKTFKQYLKEKIGDKKIKNINFRDKKYGWSYEFNFKVTLENGEIFEVPFSQCSYLTAFNDGLSIRESCYACKFAKLPRVGDITLADFWGIEAIHPDLNDKKGISLVLTNNDNGEKLISDLDANILNINKKEEAKIFLCNPRLQYPVDKPYARKNFYSNINKITIDENYNQSKNLKFDIAIMNFWWTNNYGACLTAYALQKKLEELGQDTRLVKFIYEQNPNTYYNKISDNFARKYLKTTRLYSSKNELKELNHLADKFIVGSDQVFRYEYMHDSFMLNFVDYNKIKIAYAASFGINKFNCSKKDFKKYKFLLSRFDDISTREFSGVNILKNKFNIKAEQVIDPVFILKEEDWECLIKDSILRETNYLLLYVLDENEELSNAVKDFAKKNNLKIIKINPAMHSIQDWLYLIKNAEYIVTDSYHGLCFSIIFNKNVQCLINLNRGADRFLTIKELLNLPQNIFIDNNSVEFLNFENIKYSLINKNIYNSREIAIDKLKENCALKKNLVYTQKFIDQKLLKKYFKKQIKLKYKLKKVFYKIIYKLTQKDIYYKKYQKYKQR